MTIKSRLFFSQLALIFLLGLIDIYANVNFLYWQYRWLDNPVHILGGMWVAAAFMWITYVFGKPEVRLLPVLGAVLCAGIAWEVYEFVFNVSYYEGTHLLFDTAKDLLMDLFGGIVAWYLLVNLGKKHE